MVAAPPEPGSPEYVRALRRAWRVCSVTSLGLVLIGMSSSTLNVALPSVVRHFEAGPTAATWILISYLLVNTATLVFFGRVADLLGRREVYLAGFALFTFGSLLAGFAPNVGLLIAMRVIQALGGAMILANGTVLITDAFPPDRLGQGMGVYIGTLSISQLTGPTLGGLISGTLGWQWIFWVNVPAGVIAVVWGLLILKKTTPRPRKPVDALGNLLVFLALSAALVAVTETNPIAAIACLALLPALWLVERRARNPVLDGTLFKARMLAFSNFASFCAALSRSALVLLVSLYFQAAQGVDALTAGLGILPVPVGMALGAPIAGALSRRIGPYAVSVGGSALAATGLLILALGTEAPRWAIAIALFVAGAGNGAFLTGNTTQLMSALPPGGLGVVNGFRLMIQNVGMVLSVGVALTLLTRGMSTELRGQVYEATLSRLSPAALEQLMDGFRVTYAAMFGVSLAGLVSAALAYPARGAIATTPAIIRSSPNA